jgi:NADPH-dependent 2,4-dienoyl-CoA reductase/sulfur reductase-like enzyme/nitrite reductase/ring-hydroxylating ferredoxin subunit
MADTDVEPTPDLSNGIALHDLPDGGALAGHMGEDEIVLVRQGDAVFAIGAHCTHYRGPLAKGIVDGETIRCPWHHACFNLRTGEPERAPALDPVDCWRIERVGDVVHIREKLGDAARPKRRPSTEPTSVVIVGGGAAGLAAADMLRREGYDGPVTMISADDSPPCDRPNLSKDYLAGTAQEDWIPLRPAEFYADNKIDLRLGTRVASIDAGERHVEIEDGARIPFGALLLATGAAPVRLNVPGAETAPVRYLRTFADSKAIIAELAPARQVVVVGASFIGLEVAASLCARGLTVHVVAPDSQPLERALGVEVGRFVRSLHEQNGVVFHLGTTVGRIDGRTMTLTDGRTLEADLIVAGVGVQPAIALAERAGLAIDRGVSVNEYLETSVPGIFAAGDIARYPDPRSRQHVRIEHWVVAERQGQTAARNMLGLAQRFESAPFFWSQHYDVVIHYVGHAERWDVSEVEGRIDARDCLVRYKRAGRTLAVATIGRDRASLEAELRMEAGQEL